MPGNRSRQVQADDRFQRREDVRPCSSAVGSGTKRGSTAGTCTTANSFSGSLRPLQQHGQVQRLVEQVRERVARVDGQRREHREDLAAEDVAQVLAVRVGQVLGPRGGRCPSFSRAGSTSSAQAAIGFVRPSARTAWPMRSSCSRGRHAVGAGADGDAGLHLLLQAADADHEELVEVGREDGQELEALQQRHRRVLGLLQHAAIELQPAQLAVDVQRGIVEARELSVVADLPWRSESCDGFLHQAHLQVAGQTTIVLRKR